MPLAPLDSRIGIPFSREHSSKVPAARFCSASANSRSVPARSCAAADDHPGRAARAAATASSISDSVAAEPNPSCCSVAASMTGVASDAARNCPAMKTEAVVTVRSSGRWCCRSTLFSNKHRRRSRRSISFWSRPSARCAMSRVCSPAVGAGRRSPRGIRRYGAGPVSLGIGFLEQRMLQIGCRANGTAAGHRRAHPPARFIGPAAIPAFCSCSVISNLSRPLV